MGYTRQAWADGSGGNTPITAAALTHIEAGILDASNRLDGLPGGDSLQSVYIMYSPPTIANGQYDVNYAAAEFSRFGHVVFGQGLQDPANGYHADTATIISKIATLSPKTVVWGYIPCDTTIGNFTLSALQTMIDQWVAIGAKGIFMDTCGYDYSCSRSRQNSILDYIHGKGIGAILNAWNTDDICGSTVDPTNNPTGAATHAGVNDVIMLESWVCNSDAYTAPYYTTFSDIKSRADKAVAYRASLGLRVFATNVLLQTGQPGTTIQQHWDISEAMARVFRLDATGLCASQYSAAGTDVGVVVAKSSTFPASPYRPAQPYKLNGSWTEITAADLGLLVHFEVGQHWVRYDGATATNAVNVRDYGAIGNGLADDTAAIQAAVTAAGATRQVVFPAGTYLISLPINLVSGCSLVGAGWATTIKQAAGANQTRLLQWPAGTNSGCLVADIQVDGNRANNTGATCYGIYGYALQYSTFRNVRVQNVNGDGWRLDGGAGGFATTTSTVHLLDCWAYGNANNGVVFTSYAADVHILGGDYGFSGASAVTLQAGSSSVRNAVLWGTTAGPGLLVGGQSNQITGCNIEGNSQHGIAVNQYGSYTLISDCKVYDNSTAGNGQYDGINVTGVSGTVVTGVVIVNNFLYPDLYAGGTTQRYAVNLGSFHQECQVTGNNVGFAGSLAAWSPSNALVSGEGQSDYVANNPGFNPVGFVTAPSVSASGIAQYNTSGIPVVIYVSGGAVSGIAVRGTATGLTSGAFRLGPNEFITLTYTAAPSWIWIGE